MLLCYASVCCDSSSGRKGSSRSTCVIRATPSSYFGGTAKTRARASTSLERRSHAKLSISCNSVVAVAVPEHRPKRRSPSTRWISSTSPPRDIVEIASQRFWFLPVRWLIQDKFESWKYAPRVSAPTLILAADDDSVVPLANTERLLTKFPPGVARMTVLRHCNHDSISSQPEFAQLLWRGSMTEAPHSR
jgi:pimeloyl-ACP methyl ester carboxylesterase